MDIKLERIAVHARELDALRRMLQLADGSFSLGIAICNERRLRDELVAELRATTPTIAVVLLPPSVTDPYAFVSQQVLPGDARALFLLGLEDLLEADEQSQPVLRSLNAARELWETRFAMPVLLWLTEHAADLLAKHAKDLWRYRRHTFHFIDAELSPAAPVEDQDHFGFDWAANLDAEGKQERLKELAERIAYLEGLGDESSLELRIHWLREIAFLHRQLGRAPDALSVLEESERLALQSASPVPLARIQRDRAIVLESLGRVDEALALLESADRVFQQEGVELEHAIVIGDIARFKANRGEIDAAIELHQQRLAILERIHNVRARAFALSDLAVLKAARGDTEGALALDTDALAIFEQLGDLRSRAVMLGSIANIKASRGDLVTALALLHERLAIFQQLGEARSQAVVSSQIAGLLSLRGDSEAARALFVQSLEKHRELGNVEGVAFAQLSLALLDVQARDYMAALPRAAEAWSMTNQLGRADFVAPIGSLYGRLLAGTDDPRAAAVLEKARDAYRALHRPDEQRDIESLLRQHIAKEI